MYRYFNENTGDVHECEKKDPSLDILPNWSILKKDEDVPVNNETPHILATANVSPEVDPKTKVRGLVGSPEDPAPAPTVQVEAEDQKPAAKQK